jgi:hypothetical protein
VSQHPITISSRLHKRENGLHYPVLRITRAGNLLILLIVAFLNLPGCRQTDLGHVNETSVYNVVLSAIAAELEMAVSLKVETFRQKDEWAFMSGQPLTVAKQPIDYSQTKFAADVREGYFDDGFVALLQRSNNSDDAWVLVALSLGATDAPFVDWPARFGVPKELVMP